MKSTANEKTTARDAFVTTRWSVILASADSELGERQTQAALAELCRIYWQPIFSFIVRRGHSSEDAEDLTQDFFARILKRDWLQKADRTRGRFRSLLLKSLQNFLNDVAARAHTRKRGGDVRFVSWDLWMAEEPWELLVSGEECNSSPPERVFDVGWAATIVERALRRLREQCESKGRSRVYEMLSPYLNADRDDFSYRDLAAKLNVADSTVKKLLYHFRRRYRLLLREEVAQTVADPADLEDELRHLCGALAASSPSVA